MLALAALLTLVAPASAEPYVMAGAGITVNLPRGWEMTRWSDWDLKAKADGLVLDIWYTPWQMQVPVGAALQPVYLTHLKEQSAKDPQVLPTIAGTGAVGGAPSGTLGQPWMETKASFGLDGGGKATVHFAAFTGDGKVIHVGIYGAASADRRAAADLQAMITSMKLNAPPAKLSTEAVEAPALGGFAVKPAAGWRPVLLTERENAEALLGRTGAGKLGNCVLLAAPTATGMDAGVLAACPQTWTTGFVDDDSFADDAHTLRSLVFSKAADKIPEAEKVALSDRNAMLFRPTINDHALRFAAVPYANGAVSIWAIGPADGADALESGVKETLSGLTFSGPENGLAQHAMGDIVFHALSYNTLVMGTAGLAVLGFFGALGVMMFRKPQAPQG